MIVLGDCFVQILRNTNKPCKNHMRRRFGFAKKLVNCWFGVLVGGLEFESYAGSEKSFYHSAWANINLTAIESNV